MVWGAAASRGIDDLVQRVARNDPNLAALHLLKGRKFGHEEVRALCGALADNSVLRELYAGSHAMTPESAAVVAAMLQANDTLTALSVGDAHFGDDGLVALAKGLAANSSLTSLDLHHKGLGWSSGSCLADVLAVHPALERLLLSANTLFGDRGLQALASRPWQSLRHLELHGCGISHVGMAALAAADGVFGLSSLDLSGNPLGPQSGAALAQLLTAAPALQELQLKHTELKDDGGAMLAVGLPSSSLRVLDMSDNQLGPKTGAALAAAVHVESERPALQLQQLTLAGNPGLSEGGGMEKLAKALSSSSGSGGGVAEASAGGSGVLDGGASSPSATSITSLDLSGVPVDAAALRSMSRATALRALCLFDTRLGDEGATALVGCFADGGFVGLRDLSVSGCGITLQAAQQLLGCLSDGAAPDLKVLEMGGNPACEDDTLHEAIEAARQRRGLHVQWRTTDQGPAA